MRAREAICSRLHIYEALKYNLLMLRLNKVKVCVCACVFLLNVKNVQFLYNILSCHFSCKHTKNHKIGKRPEFKEIR